MRTDIDATIRGARLDLACSSRRSPRSASCRISMGFVAQRNESLAPSRLRSPGDWPISQAAPAESSRHVMRPMGTAEAWPRSPAMVLVLQARSGQCDAAMVKRLPKASPQGTFASHDVLLANVARVIEEARRAAARSVNAVIAPCPREDPRRCLGFLMSPTWPAFGSRGPTTRSWYVPAPTTLALPTKPRRCVAGGRAGKSRDGKARSR
jgi:hypothetical protein